MTKSLSIDLADRGIVACLLHPGAPCSPVDTRHLACPPVSTLSLQPSSSNLQVSAIPQTLACAGNLLWKSSIQLLASSLLQFYGFLPTGWVRTAMTKGTGNIDAKSSVSGMLEVRFIVCNQQRLPLHCYHCWRPAVKYLLLGRARLPAVWANQPGTDHWAPCKGEGASM